jgi:hypothetical protein
VLGMFVGRWGGLRWGAPTPDVAGVGMVMPGGEWVQGTDGWVSV